MSPDHQLSALVPSEVADAPSLKAFRARLDVVLGRLVWWLATLHIAGVLKLDDHCGPFQPRPFYDSIRVLSTILYVRCLNVILPAALPPYITSK